MSLHLERILRGLHLAPAPLARFVDEEEQVGSGYLADRQVFSVFDADEVLWAGTATQVPRAMAAIPSQYSVNTQLGLSNHMIDGVLYKDHWDAGLGDIELMILNSP